MGNVGRLLWETSRTPCARTLPHRPTHHQPARIWRSREGTAAPILRSTRATRRELRMMAPGDHSVLPKRHERTGAVCSAGFSPYPHGLKAALRTQSLLWPHRDNTPSMSCRHRRLTAPCRSSTILAEGLRVEAGRSAWHLPEASHERLNLRGRDAERRDSPPRMARARVPS